MISENSNEIEQDRKSVLKMQFQDILNMIKNGCGKERCSNINCASHPYNKLHKFSSNELAAKALLLLKQYPKICKFSPAPKSLQKSEFDKLLADSQTTGNFSALNERVNEVFNNLDSLNLSFMIDQNIDSFADEKNSLIYFEALAHFFQNWLAKENDRGPLILQNSVKNLVKRIINDKIILETPNDLRFILIYFFIPNILEYSSLDLLNQILSLISFQEPVKHILINWLAQIPQDIFSQWVSQLQQIITVFLVNENAKLEDELEKFALVPQLAFTIKLPDYLDLSLVVNFLSLLYNSNKLLKKIDEKEFQNSEISNCVHHRSQYKKWKKSEENNFTFCDYPWILDIHFKAKILDEESKDDMKNELTKDILNMRNNGGYPLFNFNMGVFQLVVHRQTIVEDTLNTLLKENNGFKLKMKVKFVGEPGIDEGGLTKEFFQLLIKQFFDPNYSMFLEKMNGTIYWFNGLTLESNLKFELIGMLLGLSIYNSINLDLRFPPLIYKKLLDEKLTLDDLKDLDEELSLGFKKFLEFEGDIENVYCKNFQIVYDNFGCLMKYDLKENGENINVTNENRQEYVDLYFDWLVNKSIETQFKYFKKGFFKVVTGDAIRLFNSEELNILICGSPNLDFTEFEKYTGYENGYSKDSQLIKDLWSILHDFTQEQKKKFLFFSTGSDRVPIAGFAALNFMIIKNGEDSDKLPTAHTCFNYLLLPEYSSKKKLEEKLLIALNNAEGFGLF